MANITIIFPKNDKVRKKVRDTYRALWKAWKKENPSSHAYPISKLNQNIRKALSIHGRVLNENYFENSRYNGWSGRKVLPWCHWYYLVRFQQDLFGNITAIIEDALYEGDYHNDTMNTKPYGESIKKPNLKKLIENNNTTNKFRNMNNKKVVRLTESQLHNIIAESIKNVLMENPLAGMAANALLGAAANGGVANMVGNAIQNSPGIQILKKIFGGGGNGGIQIQNYMQQAMKSLNLLQKSGVLQADKNAASSVQQCLKSLQNFGKEVQQFKQQSQTNQQGQQQTQGQTSQQNNNQQTLQSNNQQPQQSNDQSQQMTNNQSATPTQEGFKRSGKQLTENMDKIIRDVIIKHIG